MNILVINGSPKGTRSNTLRLATAFTDGVLTECEKRGEKATIETVEVQKLSIKACLGCFSCWKTTPGTCCIKDDMDSVLKKMLWADLTVCSFPLYYFNVPGTLKTLIDRQLPLSLPFMSEGAQNGGHPSRYDMSQKKTVLVSTCGFHTPSGNYESVTQMFDRFCGKDNYTTLFCGQGELFSVKELSKRTSQYLQTVQSAGAEYAANGAISPRTAEKLAEPLYPRDVFEAMADASWGVSKDGAHSNNGEQNEKADESLIFTRQMAALYNKNAYTGRDIIIDMDYTDINKTYRIILAKDGSRVTEDFSLPYTTRIRTPFSLWLSIGQGEVDGATALMQHRYTVEGDFNLMLKWGDLFGVQNTAPDSAQSQTAHQTKKAKTTMLALLIPFMMFWVCAPINAVWGSFASLFACTALPVIFYQNKKTRYDVLSALAVSVCAILVLAKVPTAYVIPLSYLLFGIMWSASCFTKIPLTAHYSANDYGGEQMLKNPIFMRTNAILTAAWGILYLLTPIWTFFIMKTQLGGFVGAINSVLPLFMGAFTAWFQKWYPQHVARG